MPRNNNGTYTLPNPPFVVETAIDPTVMNNNFSDISQALTQSVSANGQTPLIGGFLQASGSAAAPSYSFADDPDEGMYHPSDGKVGFSVGGQPGFTMQSPSVAAGSGLTGVGGAVLCPVGCIMDFAGANLPLGWFWCNGAEVNRTSYAILYNIIGTIYGSGNGSTTYNLPDMRGAVSAGLDNMGGIAAAFRLTNTVTNPYLLGGRGGNEYITLDIGTIPAHTHTGSVSDSGHTHSFSAATTDGTFGPTQGGGNFSAAPFAGTTGAGQANLSLSIDYTGGSSAHVNTQPTIMLNKIIFAGTA